VPTHAARGGWRGAATGAQPCARRGPSCGTSAAAAARQHRVLVRAFGSCVRCVLSQLCQREVAASECRPQALGLGGYDALLWPIVRTTRTRRAPYLCRQRRRRCGHQRFRWLSRLHVHEPSVLRRLGFNCRCCWRARRSPNLSTEWGRWRTGRNLAARFPRAHRRRLPCKGSGALRSRPPRHA
jgi:hypothetical protein